MGFKANEKTEYESFRMYLQGNEWEFISEQEYKLHKYPYSGTPARIRDGKDNNPWRDDYSVKYGETNDGRYVRIGDGESFATDDVRYDPDGDGVAGEDWFNGVDDDLDGLIDEDYFESDGVDNDGDCNSDSNFDGCYCCGWFDENNNKIWDEGESPYGDENVDEFIDVNEDMWFDGVDNDGNGLVDDSNEQFTGAQPFLTGLHTLKTIKYWFLMEEKTNTMHLNILKITVLMGYLLWVVQKKNGIMI